MSVQSFSRDIVLVLSKVTPASPVSLSRAAEREASGRSMAGIVKVMTSIGMVYAAKTSTLFKPTCDDDNYENPFP